jgi:FkbH-like protein
MNITFLSNVIFEPYLGKYLQKNFFTLDQDVQLSFVLYEEIRDDFDNLSNQDIVCVCLNFEDLYPNPINVIYNEKAYGDVVSNCITRCSELYFFLKSHTSANIFWFGFEDYYEKNKNICGCVPVYGGIVDKLNILLMNILSQDVYIDLKKLIAMLGIQNAYDDKNKYRWNSPYSEIMNQVMADEICKQYLIHHGKTKKCIVLDCDNVLWGGILSEEGIENIQISCNGVGRRFWDFQRFLLDMYYHGVILTVCSKNDDSDVHQVFREHTGMLLKEAHIACFQCSWDNKPDSIKVIAEGLNIGLDSIVFVDDSVFEIELVRASLPEVTTVLFKRDSVYQELSCFNLKREVDIKEVKERTLTYKTNNLRNELKKISVSYEDYLASLEMTIDIHKAERQEAGRISELTQRTNKCTNGVRYTIDQIKNRMKDDDYELYTVCLSDKFSNLGIVGAIGLSHHTIDLFTLSCRALGRNVENQMMIYLLEKDIDSARFISTKKNNVIKDCFKENELELFL